MKRFPCLALLSLFAASRALAAIPPPVTPPWTEVAPGVWKTTIGRAESLTLLSAAGAQPYLPGFASLPKAGFPLEQKEIEGRQWGSKTMVRFPLAANEDVYGLGVDFKTVRRTGSIFQLHVDH